MKLYVDTNVLVYANSAKNENKEDCKKFFEFCKEKNHKLATSVFTLLELVCTISRANSQEKAIEYILKLEHNREILFIEPEKKIESLFDLIARIATSTAKYKAHTGDAIHLHTIENHPEKFDCFITYNKPHFEKFCKEKGIELLNPKEFVEEIKREKYTEPVCIAAVSILVREIQKAVQKAQEPLETIRKFQESIGLFKRKEKK